MKPPPTNAVFQYGHQFKLQQLHFQSSYRYTWENSRRLSEHLSPLPAWETQLRFQAPGPVQAKPLLAVWEVNQRMEDISVLRLQLCPSDAKPPWPARRQRGRADSLALCMRSRTSMYSCSCFTAVMATASSLIISSSLFW